MNTDRRENVKFIVKDYKDRFTSYTTTTYSNMFSWGLSSVISKAFVVVLILNYLSQQTNVCWKSAAETLKQDVKSVKS